MTEFPQRIYEDLYEWYSTLKYILYYNVRVYESWNEWDRFGVHAGSIYFD